MKSEARQNWETLGMIAAALLAVVMFIGGSMWAYPRYRVYSQELRGKASLREAEWSRKIIIEEANAAKQAEVTRAEGVAEANAIIGESLKGNDEYLRYLWIQGLNDGNSEVIYIPTEANMPILEAFRLSK